MTRYEFRFVGLTRKRKGKCIVCGKRMQETRKFEQSINPFNKGADGHVKDRAEILAQETAKADAWTQPLVHDHCARATKRDLT